MTLEEAIKHCEEKAKELREQPLKERMDIEDVAACEECAEEHEQLAKWLEELKRRRENQPTGKWIPEEMTFTDLNGTIETYTRFNCSNCNQGQNFGTYPYCPWCGSKMKEEIT